MPKNVNNLIIGLDFDGVIIDHAENKIKMARSFGFSVKPVQTPGHRLGKILGRDRYREIQQFIYGPGTQKAKISQGCKRILDNLKSVYSLCVISRRQPKFQPGALEWLDKNLSGIFQKNQIFFVATDKEKNNICRELKIKIFLDDKVSVLKKINCVPRRCLYDPHNIKNDFQLGDIKPVSSWLEFAEYVKAGY